jgi:hypothetical protein
VAALGDRLLLLGLTPVVRVRRSGSGEVPELLASLLRRTARTGIGVAARRHDRVAIHIRALLLVMRLLTGVLSI